MLDQVKRTGWELSPDTMAAMLIVAYLVANGSTAFARWIVREGAK